MLKQTPSQTVGPFFHYGLVFGGENILVNERTSGEVIQIKGRVYDGDGQSLPDALIEIWQADSHGIFNHPADSQHAKADPAFRGFGRSDTTNDGQFYFKTVKPGRIAWDGAHYQAPYINIHVFARGMLAHAHTRLYFSDESANETDPVLASIGDPERRKTLIARREESNDLPIYRFDIVLQGPHETVFFQP